MQALASEGTDSVLSRVSVRCHVLAIVQRNVLLYTSNHKNSQPLLVYRLDYQGTSLTPAHMHGTLVSMHEYY